MILLFDGIITANAPPFHGRSHIYRENKGRKFRFLLKVSPLCSAVPCRSSARNTAGTLQQHCTAPQLTWHCPLQEAFPGPAGQLGAQAMAVGVRVLLGAARAQQGLTLCREQQQLLALQVEACGADERPAQAQGPRAGGDRAGHGRGRGRDAGGGSAAGQQGQGICKGNSQG